MIVMTVCTATMDISVINARHVQTVVILAVLTILSTICAALALQVPVLQVPTIFLGQLLFYLYFFLVIISQSMMGVDGHQQI
jgi:hypothetical protein